MAHIVCKYYNSKDLDRKWGKHAWKETPEHIVAIPFPGGVLFGAEERYTAQRVSFFLSVEDARIVAQELLKAMGIAENDIS